MEWVTICLSSELNCIQSLVIYMFAFPIFTRQISDNTLWGIFWLSFMSKNNCCINTIVASIFFEYATLKAMQCYHNSKSMNEVYTSTRDVFNFNMKNNFLVRQHI